MTRVEHIGDATLYLGDCLEILPTLDVVGVVADLLATDPPYGVAFKSGRSQNHRQIENDHVGFDVRPYIEASLKILRRGRHAYIFGAPNLDGLALCEPAELIWDKQIIGMGNVSAIWGPQHEKITFAVHEISKANREKGYGRLAARLRRGSVLSVARPQSGASKVHPNEKPVEVLRQMIEASTMLGDTVLDPFMGSGSTGVAAVLEGRRFVGIEIDPEHFETACDRITDAYRSPLRPDVPARSNQAALI